MLFGYKLENKKNNNKKKPLKLSSSGRLQIRKNLGPTNPVNKNQGNRSKTIQIVFRNKNNQQKSSSTAQSNLRGSSSFRSQSNFTSQKFTTPPAFNNRTNKSFHNKNKKSQDIKKSQQK